MLFREEKTAVYCDKHTIPISVLHVQNAEFFNVKLSGSYSYHCVLRVTDGRCRKVFPDSRVSFIRIVDAPLNFKSVAARN